jgi:RecA-family ATPase
MIGLAERAEMEVDDKRNQLWFPSPADRFSMAELHTPPPPTESVIGCYLPKGCAAIQTGAGGTSKTGVMSVMAVCITVGLPFFGQQVKPGSVLHVSAEDRREVFLRHVYANSRHLDDFQLTRVSERLFVKDAVGLGFKLTWSVSGRTSTADDVGQLIEYAKDIPDLQLVTLDTLSRLNGGEETNEDLARFVEAMECIARETGAAVLANHHSGKGQTRDSVNDAYSGRGGSALSDNARSVLHITKVMPAADFAPSNANTLIGEGRLLRLSHVKTNYTRLAADVFIERVITPHAAQLCEFEPEFSRGDAKANWDKLRVWFAIQTEVRYPTARTIDALGEEFGSRSDRRRAVAWALDRGKLLEEKHPEPQGKRKTFFALPPAAVAAAEYREASNGY